MDAVTHPAVREVWVMKSAQVGWTEILLNVIGYYADQDPSPILLVQPTLEIAEAFSKDRLAPMVRDTPPLRAKIADARSRDSGNTLLHKKFPGGHVTLGGANSPAGLSSRPIRVVLCDEVDRYPTSAGTEGDPISLVRKRSTAFWNRKMLAGSTPTIKGQSRVEAGFDNSDQRYYFVPCMRCGTMQRLVWAQVKWTEFGLKPEEAVYQCEHCGELITDGERRQMLAFGEWRSTKPFNGIAGFHVNELMSPFVSIGDMAASFVEARKLPETYQTWINTSLGETWEESGEKLDAEGLLARKEAYSINSITPAGVLVVTIGTDVQDDRLETTYWGWGLEEECWRLGHVVTRGDPGNLGPGGVWAEHDELLRRRFNTEDGRELLVEAACVDSGGHYTQQVYKYCAKRKRFRIWAIKGKGGPGVLAWPKKPTRTAKLRTDLWLIGVDTIKDLLIGRLRKTLQPGPGYTHFDADTDQAYLDQVTSEVLVYRIVKGRKVRAWKPKTLGIRQEGLDCAVYGYAAMLGRGGRDLLASRATAIAKAQTPTDPPEDVEQQPEQPEPSEPEPQQQSAAEEPQTSAEDQREPAEKGERKARKRVHRRNWIKSWRR